MGFLGLGCKSEFVGKCECQRCFVCKQGHGRRVPTIAAHGGMGAVPR